MSGSGVFGGQCKGRTPQQITHPGEQITQNTAEWKFFLIEKLTTEILKIIITDKRILSVSVEVEKPAAIPDAKGVSVTAKYDRESDTIR